MKFVMLSKIDLPSNINYILWIGHQFTSTKATFFLVQSLLQNKNLKKDILPSSTSKSSCSENPIWRASDLALNRLFMKEATTQLHSEAWWFMNKLELPASPNNQAWRCFRDKLRKIFRILVNPRSLPVQCKTCQCHSIIKILTLSYNVSGSINLFGINE